MKYEIFLMNLWIIALIAVHCNLKLKATLCVHVLFSQLIPVHCYFVFIKLQFISCWGCCCFLWKEKKCSGKSCWTLVSSEPFGVWNIYDTSLDWFVAVIWNWKWQRVYDKLLSLLVETDMEKKYFTVKL